MAGIEQMKKKWKILDENLQKSEIINQEHIKKITMENIQTTFETWRKKSRFSLITGIVVTLFFSVQWILGGYIWQAISYFSIMLILIVLSLLERKEIKTYTHKHSKKDHLSDMGENPEDGLFIHVLFIQYIRMLYLYYSATALNASSRS